MSTPESARLDYPQGGDGEVAAAWADQQQRQAADVAAMQQGPQEHAAEMTGYAQGAPSVQQQMTSHGQAPPAVPDVGGHGSASDPIG